MKFITEAHLRDLYKKEPFTAYKLESEARLTPGARQFLADRRIKMFDKESSKQEKNKYSIQPGPTQVSKGDWGTKKFHCKLKSIEALFFLTGEELLSSDICLAQSVIDLSRQFSSIKKAVKNKSKVESISCKACTGINENNFSETLDDCFEITDFHLLLDDGRELLLLHRLRCALQEIEPDALELSSTEENTNYEDTISKVNQLINSLSQLMCSMAGVKKCQRKS